MAKATFSLGNLLHRLYVAKYYYKFVFFLGGGAFLVSHTKCRRGYIYFLVDEFLMKKACIRKLSLKTCTNSRRPVKWILEPQPHPQLVPQVHWLEIYLRSCSENFGTTNLRNIKQLLDPEALSSFFKGKRFRSSTPSLGDEIECQMDIR